MPRTNRPPPRGYSPLRAFIVPSLALLPSHGAYRKSLPCTTPPFPDPTRRTGPRTSVVRACRPPIPPRRDRRVGPRWGLRARGHSSPLHRKPGRSGRLEPGGRGSGGLPDILMKVHGIRILFILHTAQIKALTHTDKRFDKPGGERRKCIKYIHSFTRRRRRRTQVAQTR